MAKDAKSGGHDQIVIRSWPKVIFLYPVMIISFICGIWQSTTGGLDGNPAKDVDPSSFATTLGMIFFCVVCLNLLVISFEFSRFKTMAIFFFIVAVVFFLLYLSTHWKVFAFLGDLFADFRIKATSSLYYAIGFYLMIIFIGVFITTRFDYWIIRSNEILHKEGFLGDVRRYPSPNLKMTKEISDVFEFVLLGAGRVVLYPASEKQAIVLNHVLRVNAVEKATQDLLSSLSVEISGAASGMEDDDAPAGIGIGD